MQSAIKTEDLRKYFHLMRFFNLHLQISVIMNSHLEGGSGHALFQDTIPAYAQMD